MANCAYCGRKKQPFEEFSKYGFCAKCKRLTRQTVSDALNSCKEAFAIANSTNVDLLCRTDLIDEYLETLKTWVMLLDELEMTRDSVPMFTSSLDHYYESFSDMKKKLTERKDTLESPQIQDKPHPEQASELSTTLFDEQEFLQKLKASEISAKKNYRRLRDMDGTSSASVGATAAASGTVYGFALSPIPKNKWISLLLCFFLGCFGVHKFYEGKVAMGVLYIFTAGLCGIGVVFDFIMLLFKTNPYYV